ncbi:XdhC family aldehyde oxidoreductase maturation factor [Alicyclobacillus sp. SO9]|uniref:XdhC family aldehyde oxidoreductase maturation factor n=1 Tax=Alicyclobacillus sp. SO9 TaxID=2665646 RepID=UPI0018E8052C|nr:XdhC/CoxI family protein [Alicyclobacillus sp. SO9]QQE80594.1 XdhC family protein [Alicyclobacillus sp. SO9]
MKGLYDACSRLLNAGEDVVMAAVVDKQGSAPRTAGAKMLVRRNGLLFGTIGGGLLEARVIHYAKEVFATRESTVREFYLTGEDAASTEMICGGRVKVLVEYVSPADKVAVTLFRRLTELLNSGRDAWLITELPRDGQQTERLNRYLLDTMGSAANPEGIDSEEDFPIPAMVHKALARKRIQIVETPETRYVVNPVHSLGTVYLFGAGHVGQQVATLTGMVDFRTVVLDDRAEFANGERFPTVDEILVLKSFDSCFSRLSVSGDSYIVILTRGHGHDKTVLEQALATDAGYIGLISSQRKRKLLYQALQDSGVSDEQLHRVYSPVGVEIGAETPEEIAISIVAQLIQVRGERAHE